MGEGCRDEGDGGGDGGDVRDVKVEGGKVRAGEGGFGGDFEDGGLGFGEGAGCEDYVVGWEGEGEGFGGGEADAGVGAGYEDDSRAGHWAGLVVGREEFFMGGQDVLLEPVGTLGN